MRGTWFVHLHESGSMCTMLLCVKLWVSLSLIRTPIGKLPWMHLCKPCVHALCCVLQSAVCCVWGESQSAEVQQCGSGWSHGDLGF